MDSLVNRVHVDSIADSLVDYSLRDEILVLIIILVRCTDLECTLASVSKHRP